LVIVVIDHPRTASFRKNKKGNKTLKNAAGLEKRQNAEHTFKTLKIPYTNPKKTNPGPTPGPQSAEPENRDTAKKRS
jgi:hypothetical protein